MIVECNGVKYSVQWNRETVVNFRYTRCFISIVDDETNKNQVVAVGAALCVPTDQFVKEVGRKLSLRRALSSMDYCGKDERSVFWRHYHNRK